MQNSDQNHSVHENIQQVCCAQKQQTHARHATYMREEEEEETDDAAADVLCARVCASDAIHTR
jgi:hypothetical protein